MFKRPPGQAIAGGPPRSAPSSSPDPCTPTALGPRRPFREVLEGVCDEGLPGKADEGLPAKAIVSMATSKSSLVAK